MLPMLSQPGRPQAQRPVGAGHHSGSTGGRLTGRHRKRGWRWAGGQLCFEASSVMAPVMSGAFDRAVLEYPSDPGPGQLNAILGKLDSVRRSQRGEPWAGAAC